MRCSLVRLKVGLTTFLVGVGLYSVWTPRVETYVTYEWSVNVYGAAADSDLMTTDPAESAEETAVRLAEEFVRRNGYTDVRAESDKLSYESVEWSRNIEELLRLRHNTLERKAYGVLRGARPRGGDGWIVVFRYKPRRDLFGGGDQGLPPHERGRAVTMDSDFRNLRVEHKDFFLAKVEKKL